jgi:hypothetical protein
MLQDHSNVPVVTGKSVIDASNEVFKRFIDLGMVRGGKKGNWNVNGWDMILPGIMLIKDDSSFSDDHGKQYYLKHYLSVSTPYHDALPDILSAYDPITGLWPESPGYALSTIPMLLNMAMPLLKDNINTIGGNAIMEKAALAIFPWMDARGNIVNFGDGRGGPGDYTSFERLLTYYASVNDTAHALGVASVIKKGMDANQYDRGKTDWMGICLNTTSLTDLHAAPAYSRTAYSPVHRHVFMKNGNDERDGLMATIYGGYAKEKHMSPNGLALQLYAKGWAMSPDASGYESYWSADYAYHQTATGSNTILPGYTAGPVRINAMEPAVADSSFISIHALSPYCSFTDMSAAEKRRMIAIIRTSDHTGYFVDIFRSEQPDNDYLFHNLGNTVTFRTAGNIPLNFNNAADLDKGYNAAYSYFRNAKKAVTHSDIDVSWSITTTKPSITTDMWMHGGPARELFRLDAPYSNLNNYVTPGNVNIAPDSTRTIIVRQSSLSAWTHPFISVFETYNQGEKSIKKIQTIASTPTFTALKIESISAGHVPANRNDYILYSIADSTRELPSGIVFNGLFGAISRKDNKLQYLYLGSGKSISSDGYELITLDSSYATGASLSLNNGILSYSALNSIRISLPVDPIHTKASINYEINGRTVKAATVYNAKLKSINAIVPKGYNINISVK